MKGVGENFPLPVGDCTMREALIIIRKGCSTAYVVVTFPERVYESTHEINS